MAMAAVAVTACSSGNDSGEDAGSGQDAGDTGERGGAPAEEELPEAYRDHRSEVYADDAHWLCRPGMETISASARTSTPPRWRRTGASSRCRSNGRRTRRSTASTCTRP
jgi:hypothetical protein